MSIFFKNNNKIITLIDFFLKKVIFKNCVYILRTHRFPNIYLVKFSLTNFFTTFDNIQSKHAFVCCQ